MNTEPSTERHGEIPGKSYGPTILMGVLLILAIIFIVTITSASTERAVGTNPPPPTEEPSPQPVPSPRITITNPDYVSNPKAYIVDSTGQVPSQIPTGQALWVEQILSPTSIKVSYVVVQAGSKIIELKDLTVPGLGWPKFDSSDLETYAYVFSNANCWTQRVQAFFSENILHQTVYLSPSTGGLHLLISNGTNGARTDLAVLIVSSGYGIVPYSMNENLADYSLEKLNLPPGRNQLHTDQQAARLAKRGGWGSCEGL